MNTPTHRSDTSQKAGGVAALYLALAFVAAMPYFLLVVDYPGATSVAQKVSLVIANYASLYAMYLATYVAFGLMLGVLVLSLHDRLVAGGSFLARVATAAGLLWAVALVASGLVFNYGMTTVVTLAATDRVQAVSAWQSIEPIAQGLGGAGGEILGGLWVLLVSSAALRGRALPKALGWLGVLIGSAGIVSVVPALHEAAYLFGILMIVWFGWVGAVTLRTRTRPQAERDQSTAQVTGALQVGQ